MHLPRPVSPIFWQHPIKRTERQSADQETIYDFWTPIATRHPPHAAALSSLIFPSSMSPRRVLALAPPLLLLLLLSATAAAQYGNGCGKDVAGVGESCLTTPCSDGLKCSVPCGNGNACDGSVAVCAELPKEGETCLSFAQQETNTSQNCAPGLVCAFGNVCTRLPTAGEACSAGFRELGCADGLFCVNGVCLSPGDFNFAGVGGNCTATPCSNGLNCVVPCREGGPCDASFAVCAELPKQGERCLIWALQEPEFWGTCAPGLRCAFWNICQRPPSAVEACSEGIRALGCANGLNCVNVSGVGGSSDGVCNAA
jgi:hypothetical protein